MPAAHAVDTVVIGGGQAGLAISYYLTRQGREHVVLERDTLGSTWRRERWDSFRLVTQNWQLQLPGFAYRGDDPEGFLDRQGVVDYLSQFAASFQPPLKTGTEVHRVMANPQGSGYRVEAQGISFEARNVVVANGAFPKPRLPALGGRLPADVYQLHSSQYKNPNHLPPGGVLVVGSGQSGTQIAQELARSGRRVYLSVGSSGRAMRHYRGKDNTWWLNLAGQYDTTLPELLASGQKPRDNPYIGIELPRLAEETGLVLLGRLTAVEGRHLGFALDLNRRLEEADAQVRKQREQYDALACRLGLSLPEDPNPPPPPSRSLEMLSELDLASAGISNVIWATGYRFDQELIQLPVWGEDGRPLHQRGVTALPGIYFLGLYYMHKLKSGLLFGVGEDAEYIASHIASREQADPALPHPQGVSRLPPPPLSTTGSTMFSKQALQIDAASVTRHIEQSIQAQVLETLRRRGVVVGLSGGIDSSVVAALCVRALGRERVLGLLMPERDSSDDSLRLGKMLAEHLGIPALVESIGPTLASAGCYQRQEDAIRKVFSDYGEGWKCKLTLPSILQGERLNVSQLTVQSPSGEQFTRRLPLQAYLQLVAATNFKQRLRKMMEYYHADRLGYAVAGTPNRLEYDQGFFVKQGDGAADFKPIAHLYKTQVYALAEHLGVPAEIRGRPPTTDTFSMPQSQEEFYFALPYDSMDLCLYGHNHGIAASEVAATIGLSAEQVERVYRDIETKRRATRYLHAPPLLVQPVDEVSV